VCYYVIMLKETQTPPNEIEVGTQFIFNGEPQAPNIVLAGLSRAVEYAKLETRMFVFDALHHTNYRTIRHELVAEQKRHKFEESIGLVAVDTKHS
jgi:hypothetical protein